MKVLVLFILVLVVSCSSDIKKPEVFIVSVGLDYANVPVSTLYGTVSDAGEICACLNSIYQTKEIAVDCSLMISSGPQPDVNNVSFPSDENIYAKLRSLETRTEDLIVFYFSGHGNFDEEGLFLAGGTTDTQTSYSRVRMSVVSDILESKKCRSVVILDTCYSGLACDAYVENFFFPDIPTGKVSYICSSRDNQISSEFTLKNEDGLYETHGLLTSHILEILGWQHSFLHTTSIDAREVDGYLVRPPGRMSVSDLFNKINTAWESDSQLPIRNYSKTGINIIP